MVTVDVLGAQIVVYSVDSGVEITEVSFILELDLIFSEKLDEDLILSSELDLDTGVEVLDI